jgi:acetylornithine/succinyldiaminopimelate/putrescine aminotransferase
VAAVNAIKVAHRQHAATVSRADIVQTVDDFHGRL